MDGDRRGGKYHLCTLSDFYDFRRRAAAAEFYRMVNDMVRCRGSGYCGGMFSLGTGQKKIREISLNGGREQWSGSLLLTT